MTADIDRCYKQDIFVNRIQNALGVSLGAVRCHLVTPQGMKSVMGKHGWNNADSENVVGFQVGEDIFVLKTVPWTVLHELVHKAGINADRMSRFVAEGLTEAIAADLRVSEDEHKPTYPVETGWVKNTLLPALGLTPIQLGRLLAKSDDPPSLLADMLVKKKPSLDRSKLKDEFQPQRGQQPSLNVMIQGAEQREVRVQDYAVGIGAALITAGAVLIMPSLLRDMRSSR